ncbi:MAG: hypothetical protein QM680_07215 [Luteolibacter sp.]
MPHFPRPSHKELTKKLAEALSALDAKRRVIIDEERHFTVDMDELGSADAAEHYEKITYFLKEITSSGGACCYVGKFPPYKCYHAGFENVELFSFAWDSSSEGKRMYLKFGIRLSKKGSPTYLYLNCHEDQPEKRNR